MPDAKLSSCLLLAAKNWTLWVAGALFETLFEKLDLCFENQELFFEVWSFTIFARAAGVDS